jgi:hypothetical protein
MVAEQMGRTKFEMPKKELAKRPVVRTLPPTVVMQSRVAIDGNSRYNSINSCLVVSSGPLERFTVLQDSILFVNGDIEGVTSIHNSLVFCNGNIGYVTSVDSSIILATGEFKGFTSAEGSLLEIKALGAHNMATNSVFVNVTPTNNNPNMNLRRMGIVENKQIESEDSPLRRLKLFDVATAGIETEPMRTGVVVKKVTAGSPFAKAGIQVGDVLIGFNAKYWKSPDEFRLGLRRKLQEDTVTIQTVRAKQVLDLVVRFSNE